MLWNDLVLSVKPVWYSVVWYGIVWFMCVVWYRKLSYNIVFDETKYDKVC